MFQKKGINKIRLSDVVESIFSTWLRRYKIVFFIVFFGICVWGVFLWYYSLYYFQWNDQEKQTYRNSQSHWTVLNTKDFEKGLGVLDNRGIVYSATTTPIKSIFMTDPKVNQ